MSFKESASKAYPIYTVHAFRYGDRERHSYIVGVYSTAEKALTAASFEEEWRFEKYVCEVLEWETDHGSEEGYDTIIPTTIKGLPQ